MQSSLVPERPLIVSPTLAATIGLEEAVMLHVLSELLSHRGRPGRDGLYWMELEQETLMEALPFWAMIDIRRVQKSLQDLGLILVDAGTGRDESWYYAINQQGGRAQEEASPQPSVPEPARTVARQTAGAGASFIPPNWVPSREWIEKCSQHNIPEAFTRSRIEEFVLYWRERGQSRFSWGNAFYKHVLREWRQEQSRQGASRLEAPMSPDWWPGEEAQDILVNAGVSRDFIEDAVPEFVLYWRERGVAHSAWNTKFIEHIRRQWAKYATSLSRDSTPRPIPEDWEPSPEVYEILRLAEIDEAFARRKLPEFILYWRDAGQAQSSWNTRFLQYIKYSWARQLNGLSGAGNEGNQSAAENGRRGVEAAYRRFTDRSWAE